jgi:hypothetical protein
MLARTVTRIAGEGMPKRSKRLRLPFQHSRVSPWIAGNTEGICCWLYLDL